MLNKVRSHPTIPDHEVLRKIGGGAYGEVWLARGVTGALRAVKVVWREDFEDARTFEREFEGILKFEPISRDHPALMNILHVGRSPDGVSFYYYVMELGDDVATGADINPVEYQPRTLRADCQQSGGVRWDTSECIDIGLRLAEALDHLHERGLAHRDVKPANIIFVNGRAKLADIGLVAARDQRTFVGTEGFVPPEGPGSAPADIYSLGKVLYEIATGKDRMDFPELPEDMPGGADRKRWLGLNQIICDVCEPRISKRTIRTAGQLADALRRLQRGKRRRMSGRAVWITTSLLVLFACGVTWESVKDKAWVKTIAPLTPPAPPAIGKFRVQSSPEGADVFDAAGNRIDSTPTATMTAQVGEEVTFTVRKDRFLDYVVKEKLPASSVNEPRILFALLKNFTPPVVGEPWEDQQGNIYQPQEDEHVNAAFVTRANWQQYCDATKKSPQAAEYLKTTRNGQTVEIVLAKSVDLPGYCEWMRTTAIKGGYLSEDHEIVPLLENGFESPGVTDRAKLEGMVPFRLKVRPIPYGTILITTDPPGGEVYVNGKAMGAAYGPLVIPKLKSGSVGLTIVMEGYKPLSLSVKVEAFSETPLSVELEKNQGVVFGRAWENGIHMRFVPLGDDLMASIWETRVRDYELFLKEGGRRMTRKPFFKQTPDDPVVNVSREDAVAFCKWLTQREQKDERISLSHVYRLPTDLEWSRMVGLDEPPGTGPGWRDARKLPVFPWGEAWPPQAPVGNFADLTLATRESHELGRIIEDYKDGFSHTAPVGSFPANALGIFDLSGNAQEWVSDDYGKTGNTVLGILRGGGWNSYQQENLFTGTRNAVPVGFIDTIYGFRVVLSRIPPK